MGAHSSHHEPLDRINNRGTSFRRSASLRHSKSKGSRTSPRAMDKLRRSFRSSFRRRKEPNTTISEAAKPHLWQTDEKDVRSGTCFFHVKYLGCVEVFESRGMQVCEEALRVLKNSRRRPVKAILHVSGDGLRVVEDDTKGLIVDQTIEKVSFCAPDRTHDRGFSYICRDGTTRRWMCHGFLALKESGERLSHAVGCAFAVCLERKQKRDKECSVTMNFDLSNSTFTRTGSFRQQSLTEKLQDTTNVNNNVNPPVISNNSIATSGVTNSTIPATIININNNINTNYNRKENIPVKAPAPPKVSTHAIERPHATVSMLQRQGSFRGLSHLNHASPFKRQLSLRLSDLPSHAERARSHSLELTFDPRTLPSQNLMKSTVSTIPELSPTHNAGNNGSSAPGTVTDQVSAMCQQLSQGLSFLSKNDDLISSNSGQLNSTQPLSVQDMFAQKVSECSSRLIELQPAVADSSSSFFAHKSYSEDSKFDSSLLPSLQDSCLPTSVDSNLTNNNNISRETAKSSNSSVVSQHQYSTTSSIENVPLTPPDTPPLAANTQLPKPEQWLGKVSQLTINATPQLAESSTMGISSSPPIAKRVPSLALHARAYSLSSAETVLSRAAAVHEKSAVDPFNIDWTSLTGESNSQNKNTNPFLSNSPLHGGSDTASVKMFEVQM